MTYPITYLYLVSFVAVTIVFAFVVAATPRQDSKPSLIVGGYLVALWALGDGLSNMAHTAAEMRLLARLFSVVWAAIPFFFLRAALLYAGHRRLARSSAFTATALLPAVACVTLILTDRLHVEFVPAAVNGSYFESHASGWHALVAAYFGGYVTIAGWLLVAAARKQGTDSRRITGRLILFGLVPVVLIGLVVNGGLSVLGINPPYLGSVLASGFVVAGAVGIRREVFFAPLETAERERDEAREFLSRREQVLEALPAGVAIAELDTGAVFYQNDLARVVLGRSESVERLPAPIVDAARRGCELEEDQEVEHSADGLCRVLLVHARQVDYGGDRALLVAMQDISERKAVERELADQRDQLLHSQKMEAIGRLSAGVAHDFNNLLTAVLANAELVHQELGAGHELSEEVGDILHAVRHGQGLTRQLLAFSRKQAARPEVLDVNQVIESEARMLRRLLGSEVKLVVHAAGGPCLVLIDRVQLEQVLVTLATNARDAMPGGGQLTFRVERDGGSDESAAAPGAVRIEVSDTGVGMAQEVIDRIFEPFFSTKGKHGTGLGLATAYGIVTQAAGSIAVRSDPGGGAVFVVELPAHAHADDAAAVVAALEAPSPVRTVLLVDDDSVMRRAVQRVLAAAGLSVIAAASGPEALRAFERDPHAIDLLLTDVVMPEMNGLDLALQLLELRPGLPVLFLTGHRAQQRGALAEDAVVVSKPFDPPELVSLVEQLLAGDRARTTERQERPS